MLAWWESLILRNTAPAPPRWLVASDGFASTTWERNSKKEIMLVFPEPFGPTRIFKPGFSASLNPDRVLKPSTSIEVIILSFEFRGFQYSHFPIFPSASSVTP